MFVPSHNELNSEANSLFSADDVLILQSKEHREWMFSIEITEDSKYLIVYIVRDTSRVIDCLMIVLDIFSNAFEQQNLLWITEFDTNNIGPDLKWNKIFDEFEGEYDVYVYFYFPLLILSFAISITNKGPLLYVRTNSGAPQYKIVTVDISKGNEVKELIPETDATLSSSISVNKDYFAIIYKRDVSFCYSGSWDLSHYSSGQGRDLYLFPGRGENISRRRGLRGCCQP